MGAMNSKSKIGSESRLILALDETIESRAMEVAREVSDIVDAIKINWPLVLAASPEIINTLSDLSHVICDFKIADIPNTNRLIVKQAFSRGASGVIVHGFTGKDSVQAAVDAADVSVYVVTEMTHPGGEEFTSPAAIRVAQIAKEVGAAGVIAPATRPQRIRKIREEVRDLLILAPGVGVQGGRASEAIENGADYIIVGRAIYQSEDPREATQSIVEEIESAL